jgi:GTP cyclohydrolase I
MSAEHLCSTIRGIKARGCITNTAQMLGDIDKGEAIELLSVKSFLKD